MPAEGSSLEYRPITSGTRTLLKFAAPVTGLLTGATVLALVSSVLELAPFYFLYRAILVVAEGGEGARLITFGILAGVAAALQTVTWSGAMYVSHVAAYDQLHELRVELLNRLTRLPLGEVTGRHSGDLQRVVVDDVGKLELFVAHSFVEFVSAAVSWVIVTTWLAVVDYRLAAATAVVVALAYAILLVGTRKSGESIAETNAASGRLSRKLVEFLDGLLTTAVLDRSDRPSGKLRSAVTDLADANARWYGRVDPHAAAYHVLNDAAILLVIPIGGVLLLRGGVEPGHLLLFAILGLGYGIPIQRLRRIYFLANKISYAAGVVDETLEAEIQPDAPGPAPPHTSDLEFEDVCFGYGEREVLTDVSFRAPSGTLTAVVGHTGAGKSTLARLAARFWDVGSGAIRLGGIDIRDLPIDHLLSRVAFVFQDTFLFRDTVEANLRVGRPDATDDQLVEAAKAANIHSVISAMPHGYRTRVGTRGVNLSGGEKQRLAIARALLHDAPLVILDEATAFVDPDSEAVLRDSLHALTLDRTVLVVAHRLSTVAGADQILVLDGGRIVQAGVHDDLVAVEGRYQELWTDWQRADAVRP